MHELEKIVQSNLRHAGVATNQKLLLALSSGRDSVVLGEVLYRLGQPFDAAHVNYHLRGADAAADEAFAEALCKKWNCHLHVKHSSRNDLGANIQQGARQLRYHWMRQLCAAYAYVALLTAHHQADQAETFLLAAMKGRGSKAMAGMRIFDGLLLRPMLPVTSQLIASYAAEMALSWRDDVSNASLAYDRNFVRHQLIAPARERFPQLEALLAREAERLQQLEALATEQLAFWRSKLIEEEAADYQRWSWDELPDGYADWVLGRLAAENGFEQAAIDAFLDLRHKEPGKKLLAAGWTVVRTRTGADWFKQLKVESIWVEIREPGIWHLPLGQLDVRHSGNFNPAAAFCMPADFTEDGLVLRLWQQGDRMLIAPNAHKKISDLLQAQQINYRDRLQTLVLVSGQDVLWVVGLRKRIFDTSADHKKGWLEFNWLP